MCIRDSVIIGKLIPAGTGSMNYQEIQPSLPDATVMSALGLFGDAPAETADDALPANPAEWLASLGTTSDGESEDSGDDA